MIDPVLDALCAYEEKQTGRASKPRHFAIRRTWMANDAILPRLGLSLISPTRPPIPGLFRRHILGLLSKRLTKKGTTQKLATVAAAMQFKINGDRLRAFYLPSDVYPDGACLKIVRNNDDIGARTRRELDIRQKLNEMKTITMPKITSIESDDSYIYVMEELVQGQRFRAKKHAMIFVTQGVRELVATYKAFGIRKESLIQHYSSHLFEQVSAIVPDEADFLQGLEKAFEVDPDVPVSLCHRDLLPSNLCVSDGRLYFFDWEMCDEGAILSDLLKLPFKYPKNKLLFSGVADAVKNHFDEDVAMWRYHFIADTALRITQQPHKADAYIQAWTQYKSMF